MKTNIRHMFYAIIMIGTEDPCWYLTFQINLLSLYHTHIDPCFVINHVINKGFYAHLLYKDKSHVYIHTFSCTLFVHIIADLFIFTNIKLVTITNERKMFLM